ncbi:Protein of unknown function [Cotesia congregata]|uniref:DUF4371 domain-containing protein n=1 Tax=Cotesia congregata TaxID=51543 RepID=A0A8J2MNC2_COTCN|nr:Protein of unknown function [Cotesia congregata]
MSNNGEVRWLCKAPASLISAGRGEAYCKFCRVSLRAQKHDLTKHLAEIKLVLNNAAHGSLKNIDHLCEMLKDIGKGSQLSKLRLHRTKCSKIILNVIAPGMLKELLDDLGEESYSILLDESTDVSTMKYMAYCIRYYSKKQKKIVTDFLGFNELLKCSCHSLNLVAAKASEQLPSNIEFLFKIQGIGLRIVHYA